MRGDQMVWRAGSGAVVGGDVPVPRHELVVCCLVAAASLAIAAFCHRFAPGFGPVFKPLLWPLLVLPFTVRLRYALVTTFVVPLISCAVTGMPTLPMAMVLSAISAAVIAVVTITARHSLRRLMKAV